ncbi:MAG: GMC family oxidoreductase, partial [Bdellovibrionaceae bacterium]|nr:GMC family oxidoreductase [Pseudobdellovibrionaceae bacterium]
ALPLAHDPKIQCGACQSYICKKNCKNDSNKICITPAIEKFGASILTECEVKKVNMASNKATGVLITLSGRDLHIRANNVVLAAGALSTPLLLLDSKTEQFPNGLGNHSDLVGRNLMRHFVDLFALKIDSDPKNPKAKELGFNDFYQVDGRKLGTVQSFGRLPPTTVILDQMEKEWQQIHAIAGFVIRILKPILRPFLDRMLRGRLTMASILEDAPSLENRIWKENGQVRMSYTISPSDRANIQLMRTKLRKLFRPMSALFIASAEKNAMLAHACGTCRMGINPSRSVVGVDSQVHGTDNVFVVDGSVFPTSGGTNPALTIAANALRVAELWILNHQQKPATVQTTQTSPSPTPGHSFSANSSAN